MSTIVNEEKYEKFQEHILERIVRSIKGILEEKGLDEDLVYDFAGDLSFEVCAIVDASAVMEVDGEAVLPFLAFSDIEN